MLQHGEIMSTVSKENTNLYPNLILIKQKELSDEYIFIVKYHYLVSDKIDWSPYKGIRLYI